MSPVGLKRGVVGITTSTNFEVDVMGLNLIIGDNALCRVRFGTAGEGV